YNYNRNLRIGLNTSRFTLTTTDVYGREKKIPNEPTFTANANAQYSFGDVFVKESRLNLFYNFMFIDTFNYMSVPYGNNSGTEFFDVPQQFIHDAGMSYVFPNKNLIASLDAKNIFNKQAFDNFAVQKPERAFYIKLSYVFNNL